MKAIYTHCGLTTYRVDPAQIDAFVSTVHSEKLQQMGDEVGVMKAGYLLHSMSDPEVVIHITFMHADSDEELFKAAACSHPIRLELLEEAKPFLREAPGLESFRIVSILEYK